MRNTKANSSILVVMAEWLNRLNPTPFSVLLLTPLNSVCIGLLQFESA